MSRAAVSVVAIFALVIQIAEGDTAQMIRRHRTATVDTAGRLGGDGQIDAVVDNLLRRQGTAEFGGGTIDAAVNGLLLAQGSIDMTCRGQPCTRPPECGKLGMPPCCADAMFAMLNATADFLERHGFDYFVWAGTLLGAYRDKDIIPWTEDLDIAVSPAGLHFLVGQKELPYRFFRVPADVMAGHSEGTGAYSIVRGCEDAEGGYTELWDGGNVSEPGGVPFYLDAYNMFSWQGIKDIRNVLGSLTPYDDVSIRGRRFPSPRNVEEVIRLSYGADWKTPQPRGNHYKKPNLQELGRLASLKGQTAR